MTGSPSLHWHAAPESRVVSEHLQLDTIPPGTVLYRCHQCALGPIYFGKSGELRFDDPQHRYGVSYLASDAVGAFAETLIRRSQGQLLQRQDLQSYCLSTCSTSHALNLVKCYGNGLARNRLDSRISSILPYTETQALSRTYYLHPHQPDGLIYRARHDDDCRAIALFDRAGRKLAPIKSTRAWLDTGGLLETVLDRYQVALV